MNMNIDIVMQRQESKNNRDSWDFDIGKQV